MCVLPGWDAAGADRAVVGPLAPLGLSDGWSVSLAIFQLGFSAVVSVTLWRLSAWQRRYEGLEQRLQDATERLVDERLRATAADADAHVRGLVVALEELRARIQSGDAEFRAMGERDQRIELAVAAKIDLLKDYIREFAAGKKDLEKHEAGVDRKLAQIDQRLGDLTATVAVLSDRVKG
jgi:predicted  nucleic acid-binding Zn-ribbon protein